ncbi:MAG: hypothetical protein LBD73_09380 [Deferribacteraceae bacterium]|nr:hypothetical protein [Deferribacteraceae bacterium]
MLTACAGKTGNTVSKQEKAVAAQTQMDMAMQELDEGETPYVTKTKLTPSQQRALEAHRELECSLKGTCPTLPEEIPATEEPVIAEPVIEKPIPETVAEKARPGRVVANAERPGKISKYPLLNGFPIWFSSPVYDGYFGGVGVAKPQKSGGLPAQRKVAVALAQAELAKNLETVVNNEYVSERLSVDKKTESYYVEKFSTLSRQDAQQLLKNPTVIDEWLNEKTGEFFVWVAVKR